MKTDIASLLSQFHQAPFGFAAQFVLVGILLALLLPATVLLAWRRRREMERGELVSAAGCMILGLAVRSMVDPFPSDIRSATDMGFTIGYAHMWAAGYSFIQHVLVAVFPATLETVCRANILFDTLSVGLIYAVARRLLRDPAAAAAAAAVYAVYPISARFAASDSAHVLVTLCYLTSLWLIGVWRQEGQPRALFAAAAWWALACNVRMEAVVFAPAAALIAASICSDKPLRWRYLALAFLAAAPFFVFPAVDVLSHLRSNTAAFNKDGLFGNPFFHSSDSPTPIIGAALLGLGAALWSPQRFGALLWLAGVALIALPSMSPSEIQQTNYRYFLPVLALFAIPAGQGFSLAMKAVAALLARLQGNESALTDPPKWHARRLHAAYLFVLIVLIVAGSVPSWGFLRKPWTYQSEFAFVRQHLRSIADGCTIVRRGRFKADSGLEISPMMSVGVGRTHHWIDTEDFLKAPRLDGCVIYYQAASCHAHDRTTNAHKFLGPFFILPECRQMQQRFRLEPLAEGRLPVLPFVKENYTEDPVPVGFYRIASTRPSQPMVMRGNSRKEL